MAGDTSARAAAVADLTAGVPTTRLLAVPGVVQLSEPSHRCSAGAMTRLLFLGRHGVADTTRRPIGHLSRTFLSNRICLVIENGMSTDLAPALIRQTPC